MRLIDLWIDDSHPIWKEWIQSGAQLSVEYGIFIDWEKKWLDDGQELIYYIGKYKFGSLKDARKALDMKSFL